MSKREFKKTASQEQRIEVARKFPSFFQDISDRFVKDELKKEFEHYVISSMQAYPHIFNPDFIEQHIVSGSGSKIIKKKKDNIEEIKEQMRMKTSQNIFLNASLDDIPVLSQIWKTQSKI